MTQQKVSDLEKEIEDRIIFEAVKIGYKKGFLDGMNFEKVTEGLEEMSQEEFDGLQLSNIIEKDAEKVWEKYNKEFKR